MDEKIAKPITNTETIVEVSEKSTPTSVDAEQSAPVDDKTKIDTVIPSDPYYMDPLFYEVANYFSLKQEDYADAKYKLSDIVDYVIKDIKTNEPGEVLKALRKLEDRVQPPAWDEKRYTNLYRYVRLAAKKQATEQAMSAFEKGARI